MASDPRKVQHMPFIRRMQDFAEKCKQPLCMTLLDWEKAFDEIDHTCLAAALERLCNDSAIIETLSHGYKKATFFVEDEFGKSETKKQSSGIRQGCPLSPYLFVLVMTCIERDITREASDEIKQNRIPGADFDMVFYADDTIVTSRSKAACEELLEQIERISGQYGLKLNKDKCVNLNMNTEEQQTFRGGQQLVAAEEATYLGDTLNRRANAAQEVDKQIQQVNIAMLKRNQFRKASEANTNGNYISSTQSSKANSFIGWKQYKLQMHSSIN